MTRPAPVCRECGPYRPEWNHMCVCGHLASGHAATKHPSTRVTNDVTCTGRNMAGECLTCGARCDHFMPAAPTSSTSTSPTPLETP